MAGLPQERVDYFPNFIDTDRFTPPADRDRLRRELGWADRTVLLTVARLVPRKGVDRLLRALAQAGELPENWLFAIAGRGPEEEPLRRLASQLGLADRVRFLGFVPNERLADLYGAADAFALTNREIDGDTEGFGIVFLEANACGTPVLGGKAGGTGDAIADGISGFRVDSEQVDEIVRALQILLGDPEKRQVMARAGLARVRNDFSVQACAPRFAALLHGWIEQAASSRDA
jgi:phosphatidylinositol alpha-1,6-mannosyltransferase